MIMKRKLSIIILILATSLPLFFSGFFLASRVLIRITMLERIDEGKLITLHIPEKEIDWYNPGHELIYNNKMFDVKNIKLNNGVFVVTGLFDDEETELNDLVTSHTDNENNKEKSPHLIFQNCLGIIGVLHQHEELLPLENIQNRIFVYCYSSSLLDGYLSNLDLPPNC